MFYLSALNAVLISLDQYRLLRVSKNFLKPGRPPSYPGGHRKVLREEYLGTIPGQDLCDNPVYDRICFKNLKLESSSLIEGRFNHRGSDVGWMYDTIRRLLVRSTQNGPQLTLETGES